jgi:hypothetical protein
VEGKALDDGELIDTVDAHGKVNGKQIVGSEATFKVAESTTHTKICSVSCRTRTASLFCRMTSSLSSQTVVELVEKLTANAEKPSSAEDFREAMARVEMRLLTPQIAAQLVGNQVRDFPTPHSYRASSAQNWRLDACALRVRHMATLLIRYKSVEENRWSHFTFPAAEAALVVTNRPSVECCRRWIS